MSQTHYKWNNILKYLFLKFTKKVHITTHLLFGFFVGMDLAVVVMVVLLDFRWWLWLLCCRWGWCLLFYGSLVIIIIFLLWDWFLDWLWLWLWWQWRLVLVMDLRWRVGMVVGYICGWGVVFVAVGEEKGTRGKRERERITFYFILLSCLYYFISLYIKIKTGMYEEL